MGYVGWIRSQVGHRKIFLVFASVVLRDALGRILLQYRTDFKVWGLPGGSLELDEGLEDCARRELLEETGCRAGPLRLVGVYTDPEWDTTYPNGDQVQQYSLTFTGELLGEPGRPDGEETSDQRFFAPADVPFDNLPPYYTAMVRDALASGSPTFHPPYSTPNTIPQIETVRPLIGPAPYIGTSAMAVIRSAEGCLLLQQRGDGGGWCFPGGYMNLGENVAHTVVREAEEETGLQVVPERIIGLYSPALVLTYPNGDQVRPVITVFCCRPVEGELRVDGRETSALAWVRPEAVRSQGIHPQFRDLYAAVLEHLDEGCFVI